MAETYPTIPLFFNMHNTSHSGPLTYFPAARGWNIFADPKIEKISETRWHSKWCFMRGGMGDEVPKKWTSLEEAKHPKFMKTALIKAHIATLKRLFNKPLHYKVFCEQGVLVHAGLIRSKEFDQAVVPPVDWGIASYILA
ncbi:hypothetical protein LIER_38882 [Lithospermum erythrorhizon]|uniref:Uncharacterized protein n=1 Tax=Lithospermum erythrorhizon TaxID=34254 RepID=A0AAV3Q967_LITER